MTRQESEKEMAIWVKRLHAKYPAVPITTLLALVRYCELGSPCGHFVTAVLENNLVEAFCRADEHNTVAMRDIAAILYNHLPWTCWGSAEKVESWKTLKANQFGCASHTDKRKTQVVEREV